jgi:hypothetical protein
MKIWLDGQVDQGDLHAPFSIDADGEELRLSTAPSEGYRVIDSVFFGPQEPGISQGRKGDGSTTWTFYSMATPGSSNLGTGLDDGQSGYGQLMIFPNPVYDGRIRFSRPVSGWIVNNVGQRMLYMDDAASAGVEGLAPGMYVLITDDGENKKFMVAED